MTDARTRAKVAATPFETLDDEQLGRLVWDFYERVLADTELAPFFARTDMAKLFEMQREYVRTALGGAPTVSGDRLAAAHAGRGIRGRHYVRFLDHLLATLRASGLDESEIDRVLDRMAIAAGDILGDTTTTG